MMRPSNLIRHLKLQPHPEGGYFREVHRSQEPVDTEKGRREAVTTIYFLLVRGQKSLLHRVLSDEIWHFYEGAPLKLVRLSPDFKRSEILTVGPVRGKAVPVAVIPRGFWQAAATTGDYTLVGCSVGPGFVFEDFTMLRDDKKDAATVKSRHPKLAKFVG